jgi:hypothetical protein
MTCHLCVRYSSSPSFLQVLLLMIKLVLFSYWRSNVIWKNDYVQIMKMNFKLWGLKWHWRHFKLINFCLMCTIKKFNEIYFAKRSCPEFIKKPLVGLGVLAKWNYVWNNHPCVLFFFEFFGLFYWHFNIFNWTTIDKMRCDKNVCYHETIMLVQPLVFTMIIVSE